MTNAEQKSIDKLWDLLSEIKKANGEFQQKSEARLEKVESQVKAAYLPVNLEQDILRTAQIAVSDSIKVCLGHYNSPLTRLVEIVVNENSGPLKNILSENFTKAIETEEFREAVRSSFVHKVAKNLVSGADSLFTKTMNDLKQDSVFKAKMILAVEKIVEESLKD